MPEYSPKISERRTDELIEIANSSTKVWQPDTINQSKSELKKRNITEKKQDDYFENIFEEINNENKSIERKRKSNELEKYNVFEMIFIVIVSPSILMKQWGVLYELKLENYTLKFKQRIVLLIIGMIIWSGYFYYEFDKWQKAEFNKESRC